MCPLAFWPSCLWCLLPIVDQLNTLTDYRHTWWTLKPSIPHTNDSQFAKMLPDIPLMPQPWNAAISTGSGKYSTSQNSWNPPKKNLVSKYPCLSLFFYHSFLCCSNKQEKDKWIWIRRSQSHQSIFYAIHKQ